MLPTLSISFPDMDDYKPSKQVRELGIMNNESGHEMDSSLLLWNKSKLGNATELLKELSTTYREELFQHIWGDKVCCSHCLHRILLNRPGLEVVTSFLVMCIGRTNLACCVKGPQVPCCAPRTSRT